MKDTTIVNARIKSFGVRFSRNASRLALVPPRARPHCRQRLRMILSIPEFVKWHTTSLISNMTALQELPTDDSILGRSKKRNEGCYAQMEEK